jgi:TPR repeat protein
MSWIRVSPLVTLTLLAVSTLSAPGLARAARPSTKPIVAVFDIQTKRVHLSGAATSALTAYLASRLTSTGAYQVVPRDQLKTALRKQKTRSYKRCYKQSCRIAIGQELSAHKSLATEIMRIGKRCVVTLALYDLKKATTDRGADASGRCSEDRLMVSIKRAVRELANGPAASRPTAPSAMARPAQPATQAPSTKATRALRGYERRCDDGDGVACAKASAYYYFGRGVAKNVAKAITLARDACAKKVAPSCHFVGLVYLSGRHLTQSNPRAATFIAKACKLGRAKACANLGLFFEKGLGVAKDIPKAKALYRRACAAKVSDGCNNLAMLLALRREHLTEALRVATQAVKLSMTYQTLDTLAFVLLQRKAYDAAEKVALKALSLAPKNAALRRRLRAIRRAGRAAEQRAAGRGAQRATTPEGNEIGG